MKVICITPIVNPEDNLINAMRPEVGDIDEVSGEHCKYEHKYYTLVRFGPKLGYMASCFAILPDQPENELEELEHELEEATA